MRQLRLSYNLHLTTENVRHLARAAWPKLDLLDNRLNAAALACLADAKWPELTEVYLNGNRVDFDHASMSKFVQGIWPELTLLDLDKNKLSASAWPVFVKV